MERCGTSANSQAALKIQGSDRSPCRNKGIATRNKGIATRSKKLLGALLALLVTRSAFIPHELCPGSTRCRSLKFSDSCSDHRDNCIKCNSQRKKRCTLFLVANLVTSSKALVTRSDALVSNSLFQMQLPKMSNIPLWVDAHLCWRPSLGGHFLLGWSGKKEHLS